MCRLLIQAKLCLLPTRRESGTGTGTGTKACLNRLSCGRLGYLGVGLAAGLLSLSACDPLPEAGQYTLTVSSPTAGQSNVPLTLDVTASITNGFTLHESA